MQADSIRTLMNRIPDLKAQLTSEEGTKHALVLPFLGALGYDVFNPREIDPEFRADVGTKPGEKVDYAVMDNGKPVMLIECKQAGASLAAARQYTQLYRYFGATEARIAVLTNGIIYRFYSDLDAVNKMDEEPFLEVDLENPTASALEHLRQFAKGFNVDQTVEAAAQIRYVSGMKAVLLKQYSEPDDDFVEWLGKRVFTGRMTPNVKQRLTRLARRSFHEVMAEHVQGILSAAQTSASAPGESVDGGDPDTEVASEGDGEDRNIVTTAEELEGYEIVKDILRDVVSGERVTMRDRRSYCAILLDNNGRRQVCRFYFNTSVKRLALFDGSTSPEGSQLETRVDIQELNDIYEHSGLIQEAARRHAE